LPLLFMIIVFMSYPGKSGDGLSPSPGNQWFITGSD
jgi:hypothetical protein